MCIYLTNQTNLHYQKQEHIIPAALGGIAKLGHGVVSDEFNREIAELERDYMRSSIFAGFSRTVQGPGIRGSLSADKQVRSNIHVLVNQSDPDDLTLGYIQKGVPHQISQIRYHDSTRAVHVQFPKTIDMDIPIAVEDLLNVCKNVRNIKTTEITSELVPLDVFLFGYLQESKGPQAFFARHPQAAFQFAPEHIEKIGAKLVIDPQNGVSNQHPVISNTTNSFKIEHHRVHAKIAFNYLAHIYGAAFVKQSCFDEIRSWIVNGGANNFVSTNQDEAQTIQQVVKLLPPYAHAVILTHGQDHIFVYVIIYGYWTNMIVLTRNAPHLPPTNMRGLVCDWQNRKEIDLSALFQ